MAASYPGAIKNFSAIVNGVTKLVAALFNAPYDEITAIETELGVNVAGSASDLVGRLNAFIGNAVDKTSYIGTSIEAPTAGIVKVWSIDAAGTRTKTDAANPPTTLKGHTSDAVARNESVTFIAKGDYWLVEKDSGTPSVDWIPLGDPA